MEGLAAAVGQRQECAEQDDQAGDVQQDATNSSMPEEFFQQIQVGFSSRPDQFKQEMKRLD